MGDEDLKNDLLQYSVDKPQFIAALLQNASIVDPVELIQNVAHGVTIPNLRSSVVEIFQEYHLQVCFYRKVVWNFTYSVKGFCFARM